MKTLWLKLRVIFNLPSMVWYELTRALETDPSLHRPLEPHKWVQRFKASDGSRDKDMCVKCMAVQPPDDDTPTAQNRYETGGVRIT